MGRFSRANIQKTWYYLRRNGLRNTFWAVRERLEEGAKEPYVFEQVSREVWEAQRLEVMKSEQENTLPLFSILVPAYRTGEKYLRDLIASLQAQSYPYWELVLADATEDDSVRQAAEACGACSDRLSETKQDERIRYVKLETNGGISENSNRALNYVRGRYVGLLDHDDMLTPDALYEIACVIKKEEQRGTEVKILYSDEDKCDSEGQTFYEPNRKEKFNLDLLLSNNYICHFLVMERELIKELGFRKSYEGAQDYDLVLRAAEKLGILQSAAAEQQIVHIPRVLYHWRCHEASTAQNPQSKRYAYEAGLAALQDLAKRAGWQAEAVHLKHLGFYRLRYEGSALAQRADVGALGGRLISRGRVTGGRMSGEGKVLYFGMPSGYSGGLHRAVLTQDAEALDIRCLRIKIELHALFKKVTGVPYREKQGERFFDADTLPEGTDVTALSLKLSAAVREAGYRLLYDPCLEKKQ